MRNRFIVLFVTFLVLVFVSGCGNSDEVAGGKSVGKEEITMWFWGAEPASREVLQEVLIDKYNESQDKYELVVEYRNSVDSDLNTALAANQGPDIVYGSGPAFVKPLAEAGKLEPLNTYSEQYGWKDRMMAPIYETGKVEDELYAIGGGLVTVGIFYNQKVLDDNGWKIPTTIEELEKIMDEAEKLGMYKSTTGNKGWKPVNENYSSLFLTHFAGSPNVYKALKGELEWDDQVFVDAINQSAQWYQNDYLGGGEYLNLNFAESLQFLAAEQTPFFIGPTIAYQWASEYFTGEDEANFKFMPFPSTEKVPEETFTVGLASTYSINANADQAHKDEAAKIIDMMIQEEFVQEISSQWPGYWGMPLKELNNIKTEGMGPMASDFIESYQKIVAAVDEGKFGYMTNVFFPPATQQELINIENVWLGTESTEELLGRVNEEFKVELEKGLVPDIPAPDMR